MAVAATRLVADFKAVRQAFEDLRQFRGRPDLNSPQDLAGLVQYPNRNPSKMNVESNVEHTYLSRSEIVRANLTSFYATGPTETSYIDSHRSDIETAATPARNDCRSKVVERLPWSRWI